MIQLYGSLGNHLLSFYTRLDQVTSALTLQTHFPCMCVCIYVCVYVYICVCIYMCVCMCIYVYICRCKLPRWCSCKESAYRCKICEFHPWVRKIPWRRQWQPTLVFLPGKNPWTEEPGGLRSMELQRVRHD